MRFGGGGGSHTWRVASRSGVACWQGYSLRTLARVAQLAPGYVLTSSECAASSGRRERLPQPASYGCARDGFDARQAPLGMARRKPAGIRGETVESALAAFAAGSAPGSERRCARRPVPGLDSSRLRALRAHVVSPRRLSPRRVSFLGEHRGVHVRPSRRRGWPMRSLPPRTSLPSRGPDEHGRGGVLDAARGGARHHGAHAARCDPGALLPIDASRLDSVVSGLNWLMSPRGTVLLAMTRTVAPERPPRPAVLVGRAQDLFGPPLRLPPPGRLDTSPAWVSWVGTAPALELVNRIGVQRSRSRRRPGIASAPA